MPANRQGRNGPIFVDQQGPRNIGIDDRRSRVRKTLYRIARGFTIERYLACKGDEQMSTDEPEDNTIYKVVVNHEEQYSIWPAEREAPLGWREVDKTGTKPDCLAYIKEVWTDMRPLSLRKKMEESEG